MQLAMRTTTASRGAAVKPMGRSRSSFVVRVMNRPQLAEDAPSADGVARRRALLALFGAAAVAAAAPPQPALAVRQTTVCADQDTGEEADVCRAAVLQKDAGKQEDYAQFEGRSAKVAPNVPVSAMDDEYTKATLALAATLEAYLASDPYDKGRGGVIRDLKSGAQAWVTKYARGGSVRKQSARRFYVAVDAVLGYLASNGLAPFPAGKAKTVRATVDEALVLLGEGK